MKTLWDWVVFAGLLFVIAQFSRLAAGVFLVLGVASNIIEGRRIDAQIEADAARWKQWIVNEATEEQAANDPMLRKMYGDYNKPFHPVRFVRDVLKK